MEKFVPPPPKKPALVLRQPSKKTAETSLASRRSIEELMRQTRAPFLHHVRRRISTNEIEAFEQTLRDLERQLLERERTVDLREAQINERERTLWESEALLEAREKILMTKIEDFESSSHEGSGANTEFGSKQQEALLALSQQIENQQSKLKQQREEVKERETFLEHAEASLFDKTLEQQEREAELEQREEELAKREALLCNPLMGGDSLAEGLDNMDSIDENPDDRFIQG